MRGPALPRPAGDAVITAGQTAAPRMRFSLPARSGLPRRPNRVRLLDQSVKLTARHAESLLTGKSPFALTRGNPRRGQPDPRDGAERGSTGIINRESPHD